MPIFVEEMKRIISISLLSILLSYSFNQIGIFAEYVMDIETFTELYCENTDKPELECNGKCHLADQLAENEEQKQDQELQSPPEILLFHAEEQIDIVKAQDFFVQKKTVFYFNQPLSAGKEKAIFHPPQTRLA